MNRNKLIVKKHSALIQISVKELTLIQRKLINSLIFIAQNSEKISSKELYKIPLASLKRMCNINRTDNEDVKRQLSELADIKIEFNILDKDNQWEWRYMCLLSEARCKENTGFAEFAFPPTIIEEIIKPRMYSPLDVCLISGLKSSYSIVLYEFLRDYLKLSIPKLTIKDFKDLMGVSENKYSLFKDFKKKVIDFAIKEINEKTDISCNYKLIKELGNKYSHIQFYAKNKEKLLLLETPKEEIKISNKIEIPESVLKLLKEEKTEPVIKLIKEYIEKGKTEEYLISNVKYSLKNNIKNFPVYLKKSLEEDYAQHEREKLILTKTKKQRSLEEQRDLEKEYLKLYFPEEEYSEKIYSKN